MLNHLLKLVLILTATLSLAQCGGEDGLSSQVDFEIEPKSPIVILADLTLNPGSSNEKKIAAPWFAVSFTATNNSVETVTIQSLKFKITAITTAGTITTKETSTDAGDYPNETYLEEIAPNSSVTPNYIIYIGSNEKSVNNYSYRVTVDVQGWIGTSILPKDRLVKSTFFVTK